MPFADFLMSVARTARMSNPLDVIAAIDEKHRGESYKLLIPPKRFIKRPYTVGTIPPLKTDDNAVVMSTKTVGGALLRMGVNPIFKPLEQLLVDKIQEMVAEKYLKITPMLIDR